MYFSNPLTEEQLEFISPILHKMAQRFAKCEADRLDLVQTAFLALFDGKRKWKNALVCSYSAMLDYIKKNNRWRQAEQSIEERTYEEKDTLADEDFRSLKWLGLDLDERHRQAAIWHWIDGHSQQDIAATLGVPFSTISRWLGGIKEKIKRKFEGKFDI